MSPVYVHMMPRRSTAGALIWTMFGPGVKYM